MTIQWKTFAAGAGIGAAVAVSIGAVAQDASRLSDESRRQMRRIADAYGAIRANFAEPVDEARVTDGCIGGMVRKIDPGGDYLDAAAFRELQVGSGPTGGLGFEMSVVGDRIRIVSPLEGTPAQRGGIRPGDMLLKVDGTDTTGLPLSDVVKLLRGKPGSEVKLGLSRDGAPLEMTLTRELIRISSVRSRLLEQGVGYVRVSTFQEATTDSLAKALRELRAENKAPLRGIVLDLRNNPGGLLSTGIGVAATFLQDDVTVVQMDGRNEDAKQRYTTNPKDFQRYRTQANADFRAQLPEDARKAPLVVLVNGGSAAASEIVAGAMQDYKRGTVIGTKTFGRGSVQTIMPMGDNTALKLTTAYWYLPSGRAIHGKGIAPDVVLDDAAARLEPGVEFGAAEDLGLQRALKALRK